MLCAAVLLDYASWYFAVPLIDSVHILLVTDF